MLFKKVVLREIRLGIWVVRKVGMGVCKEVEEGNLK